MVEIKELRPGMFLYDPSNLELEILEITSQRRVIVSRPMPGGLKGEFIIPEDILKWVC